MTPVVSYVFLYFFAREMGARLPKMYPFAHARRLTAVFKLTHDLVLESTVNMAVMTSHDSNLDTSNPGHASTYHYRKKILAGKYRAVSNDCRK